MHHLVLARIQLDRHWKVSGHLGRFCALHNIVRKVREYAAAVGGLPPEELERELIRVVVAQLLRDEVVNAGLLVDLWKLPVVSEGVNVPSDFYVDIEFLLEVTLAEQKLPDLGFAVRHVEIWFDPHAAH
jgi:hypothetical protein